LEQDEAVGGEDLADLEAGAVQRGGGSRSSAAGGASQAWRSSAGGWNFPGEEEQRRRVDLQVGRSRAGGWTFRQERRLGAGNVWAALILPARGLNCSRPPVLDAMRARTSAAAKKTPAQLGRPPTRRLQRLRPAESAPSRRRAPPRRCARLGPQLAP